MPSSEIDEDLSMNMLINFNNTHELSTPAKVEFRCKSIRLRRQTYIFIDAESIISS